MRIIAISLVAALAGCIDAAEEPELSETASGISILGSWELSATTNNVAMFNVGSTADRPDLARRGATAERQLVHQREGGPRQRRQGA